MLRQIVLLSLLVGAFGGGFGNSELERVEEVQSKKASDHRTGEIKMNKFACVMQCNANENGSGLNTASGFSPSIQGSNSGTQDTNFNKQTNSGGTAAGAGTASVIDGQATSNNNAEQFAVEHGDRESGSSLNAASGFAPNTQGAARGSEATGQQKGGQKFQNNNRRWN